MTPNLIRDKRALVSLLVANLFVMAGALFVLRDRYQLMSDRVDPSAPPAKEAAASVPSTERPAAVAPKKTAKTGEKKTRNILFSYRNSKPTRVELIGSFNDWEPKALKKGKDHTWSLNVPLEPGEYTYNFLVDGKAIRDPNNRRTAAEGRSLLTVKPFTE